MKIKVNNKEGELISSSDDFLIVKIDGKETSFRRDDNVVYGYKHVPCEGCSRDCYNFQMMDCKDEHNYEWSLL